MSTAASSPLAAAGGAGLDPDFSPDEDFGFEAGETGRILSVSPPLSLVLQLDPQSIRGSASGIEERSLDNAADPADSPSILDIRLAEIDAPDEELAANALAQLVEGRNVRLSYGGARRDRYGRALAQLEVETDEGWVWVQAALVDAGQARVMPYPDNHAATPHLLGLEARARAARRGFWADPAHAVMDVDPNGLARFYASVQIVEGRVTETAQTRSERIYLNFGADYRSDFTILVEPGAQSAFEGMDLLALEGRLVRVRGWISEENGPLMRLDHPSRLEILEPAPPERPRPPEPR